MLTLFLFYSHYISLPQLALDMMLKTSKVELELLTDIDQFLFVERGIRGGVSFIASRYEHQKQTKQEKTSLLYIDGKNYIHAISISCSKPLYFSLANNLYGSASTLPLPHRDFSWEPPSTHKKIIAELPTMDVDQERGYILSVDLEYPSHLHKAHSSFPLAPEKRIITKDLLSDYASGKVY